MRKSHFNDEFLVLLGPIISRLFTCSNAEKNKQRVLALVLSIWFDPITIAITTAVTVAIVIDNVWAQPMFCIAYLFCSVHCTTDQDSRHGPSIYTQH
jgi:hypothetical protein